MTKKPRITLTRGWFSLDPCCRWMCQGHHPDQQGPIQASGFGPTPAAAYLDWLKFWEIPF